MALVTITFVIGSYSTLVPQVQAASHARGQQTPATHAHPPKPLLKPVHPLAARVSHQRTSLSPHVSGTTPFDGLGQLLFSTYITHPITSPTCTCGQISDEAMWTRYVG